MKKLENKKSEFVELFLFAKKCIEIKKDTLHITSYNGLKLYFDYVEKMIRTGELSSISSLKSAKENLLNHFNERDDDLSKFFWEKSKELSFELIRTDHLYQIKKNKGISTQEEYDYVIDNYNKFIDEKIFTKKGILKLNEWINKFEENQDK